jgi:DNA anti-recombination protein RmuC
MQRMTWTDERLKERFERIDERFDQVDRRFDRVEGDLVELKQGMAALHNTLHRGSIGVVISLVGVIGAILIKGG